MEGSVFFICGIHTSGKTTILKRLEDEKIITFRGSEIGKELYYERKVFTEDFNEDFEKEISILELERDFKIQKEQNKLVGIETWHPGNMAYAAVRNPSIFPYLKQNALKSPFIENAYGIWVKIDVSEMIKRTTNFKGQEEWAKKFYKEIDNQFEACFEELGLADRIHIVNGDTTIDTVLNQIKSLLK